MKKEFLAISLSTLLSLSLISCSSGIKATTSPESYSDLDKEYGQFNTKALTVSYLKKKLDKWKTDGNGKKMLRELEYAKFKHIDVLEQVINSEPDSYAYYQGLKNFIEVTGKEGNDAAFKSFIISLSPDPSISTSLDATNVTTTSFTANWNAVSNADGYMLIVDNGTPIDVGKVTSKNITGLNAGSSHSYVVKSVNEGGISEASSPVNVTLIPSSPVATDSTNINQTSFTANWGSVTGATSYKLFVDNTEVYSGSSISCNVTSLVVGSSHSYYVQAINAGGTSTNSNTINLTLNPAIAGVPVASDATDITQTSFTAHWASVNGATSYKLFIDDVEAYSGTNLNFSKTGLTVGSSHSYYVQAINISGASANSNSINVTLNPAIPSAPVANVATDITTTSFTANWATVSGATSYKLFIDDVEAYSGTNLNFSKTGLTAGTAHKYYVQAINISGTGSNSNTVDVSTVSSAPIASDATNINNTSFTANWASVTGATGYKLFVDGINVYTGASTSANITGLTANSSHSYYVQATNSGGTSVNSNTVNLTLNPDAPTAPVANVATDITNTSFTANWASSTNATSYTLYVNGTSVYTGSNTSFSKTGLIAGTAYTYYVTATNITGTSANSNTVNVSTVSSAPVASAATNITTTSFTANWGTVTGAITYNLFVDGVSVYNGSSTSTNITGLTAGTAHSYYVQAVNSGGTSPSSTTINVSTVASAPVASAATSITDTSFTANWATVSGATSYNLYIDSTLAYSGSNLSFNKTGLTASSAHSYYVQAVNSGGTSANSGTINVTLNPATPLAPVASAATSITTTSFTANWASSANASSYTLYVNGTSVYTGSSTSANITSLTAGTAYNYYVTATNITGTSPSSTTINVNTVPSAPVATTATSIGSTGFTANWGSVTGATTYKLYVDGTNVYTGTALTYAVTGMSSATTHNYYVTAINSGGTSANSNTISPLTLPVAPVANAASGMTTVAYTANWSSVTGATGYKLYLDGSATPITLGVVTSYNVTGLSFDTSHNYYVVATNATGSSVSSNTISFTLPASTPVTTIATNLTTTSYTANWNSVLGATGYKLYLDGSGTPITLGNVTSYSVTGLTKSTTHTYYVKAVVGALDTAVSNTTTVKTADIAFGITGAGYFMVADTNGTIYFTKEGGFYRNTTGQLVNPQGLILVDRPMAINLNAFTPSTATVAEINTNTAGWQRETGYWFPYVAGTNYEEPSGNYTSMTVLGKYTFGLATVNGSENLTMHTDDTGVMIVNGTKLTSADKVSGGNYPSQWDQQPIMKIGPYLRVGFNTIVLQVTEGAGGEFAEVTGANFTDINGNAITTYTGKWAIEIRTFGNILTAITEIDTPTYTQVITPAISNKDFVLANTAKVLEVSSYGSTILKMSATTTLSDFTINYPTVSGLGTVISQ